MTGPPSSRNPRETKRAEVPNEYEHVHELLRLFGKAARAHQMYLPNNPVYKAAHDALRAGFVPVWEQDDQLVLTFTESEVKYEGETVLEETTRGSDSLPWLFYKDGVRELRLQPGFETQELDRLLSILQRVRKASPDEDDLLTLLWQGDFELLRYRYVDLSVEASVPLADGGEALRNSSEMGERNVGGMLRGDGADDTGGERSGVVSMSDFDATLYFLDDREIEYLRTEIAREYGDDLRRNVVNLLLDIYEQQAEPGVRTEVAEIIDNLMVHMLAAGQFANVAYLVRESLIASRRAVDLVVDANDRLAQLPARLSAPEALTQLLEALNESVELPSNADVIELFEQLRGNALGTILDWLGKQQNARLRPMLEQAASRLASQHTAELVKLILSNKPHVALEAVRRAGSLQTPAAVAPLSKVLGDAPIDVRLATVQSLNEIGSAGALQALERAVEDQDRDVRVAAIRALQTRSYRPMLSRLDGMIKGRAIKEADLTEKMAIFEAYGTLCGEGGVAGLDSTLNSKSMFGRREDAEMRACAAVALGRIKSLSAVEALRKAVNEKDVVVRNAVSRALRGM